MSANKMRRKIGDGREKVVASWSVDKTMLGGYLREQVKSDRRQAIRHSFILPIIFFIVLVVQTKAEDFSSWAAFFDYFRLTVAFPMAFFVLVFPLLTLSHWIKRKRLENATEAHFGEEWLVFGHIYVHWKSDNRLERVYVDEQRYPKVIGFNVWVRPTGRGQVNRSYEIPIPESQLEEARALEEYYSQHQFS